MADYSPTQQVIAKAQRLDSSRTCDVAVAVNEVVYITATNTVDLANNATDIEAGLYGVGLVQTAASASGTPTVIWGNAEIDMGSTVGTKSEEVVLSSTDGNMHPKSDLQSGEYYTILGYWKTADIMVWQPRYTGVTE